MALPTVVLPSGSKLFHGTIEPLEGDLRPGGYDSVLWFADAPGIAQLYIPHAGLEVHASSEVFARPTKDSHMQAVQRAIGIEYDLEQVRWDHLDRPVSYLRPPELEDVGLNFELNREVERRVEALGYERQGRGDQPGFRRYRFLFHDGRLLAPGEKVIGSLCIATTRRPMTLWVKARGESDLQDLQYHDVPGFRRAQREGLDGMVIDDFAQSKEWGNLGHLSVGLFAEALPDLSIQCIPATYEEWDFNRVGTQAYPHPSPTSLVELLRKANPRRAKSLERRLRSR